MYKYSVKKNLVYKTMKNIKEKNNYKSMMINPDVWNDLNELKEEMKSDVFGKPSFSQELKKLIIDYKK